MSPVNLGIKGICFLIGGIEIIHLACCYRNLSVRYMKSTLLAKRAICDDHGVSHQPKDDQHHQRAVDPDVQ